MKQLVIFDLDGTLLNTIDDLAHAANYALHECGFPTHDLSVYPFFVGNGVGRLLERVLPPEARSKETVDHVRSVFQPYYDRHLYDHTKPYPGVTELLETLTRRGVNLAVASNKYQSATSRLIARFYPRLPWVAVHGMRPDVPAKPDPSVVFNILGYTRVPKAEVLYVGDSGVDIETARRACVESCGVTWGFRPLSELRQFYAEHIVSEPSAILDIVEKPFVG